MSKKKINFKIPSTKVTTSPKPKPEELDQVDKWVSGEAAIQTEQKTIATATKSIKKKRLSAEIEETIFKEFKKICVEEGITIAEKVQTYMRKTIENTKV